MLDNRKSLTKNAVILSFISGIGIILSFAKESVIAFFFGTSATADAYVVAVDLPLIFFSMFSSAISVVVIPNYTKVLACEGRSYAQNFFSNLITIFLGSSIILAVVLILLGDFCVHIAAPGLSPEIHELAVRLFYLMIPASVFLVLVKIHSGVLNVHGSFALPAMGDLILSIVFIVIVVMLQQCYGIYAAAIGSLVGAAVECIYSILLRRKYMKYHFTISLKDVYVKQSIRMVGPVFLGLAAAEINALIDKAIASSLGMGGISGLHYASKISSGISNLLISGISTVFYPEYAKHAANRDDKGMAQIFNVSVSLFILIILPLIFGGFFLKEEIVSIVYGRGAFDEESLVITAPLLAGYIVGLLFNTVRHSGTNFFNALGDTKTPVINSTIGIGINIVLNLLLSKFMGVLGLVIATVAASAISAFLLMIAVKKRNNYVDYRHNLILLVKCIGACFGMVAVLFGVRLLLSDLLENISTGLNLIVYTLCTVVIGGVAYGLALVVLRANEVKILLNIIKNRKDR